MSELYDRVRLVNKERRPTIELNDAPEPVTLTELKDDPSVVTPESERDGVTGGYPPARSVDFSQAAIKVKLALDPLTVAGEQFRLLRAELSHLHGTKQKKRFLITSALSGEGKTFMATGLAGVLALEPGRRVLLVDGDLRRGAVHITLGLNHNKPTVGLCQLLRGEAQLEDVLLTISDREMCFVPAGTQPPNPSELLSSPVLRDFLDHMAQSFDWIIVDSPPVLGLADGTVLSDLCDTTLMVVQADKTPSRMVHQAIEQIGREKIGGVILNRVKKSRSNPNYYKQSMSDSRIRKLLLFGK